MPAFLKNMIFSLFRFINALKRPSPKRNRQLLQQRGENIDSFSIREATIEDVPVLAALHVTTWNDTYNVKNGGPSVQLREHQWREKFSKIDDSWFVLLMQDASGKPIGFINGNRFGDGKPGQYEGEINKIYLLRDYQRMGLGGRLFCALIKRFRAMGIHSMILMGTPQNPSGRFHEAMGGEKEYNEKGEFIGNYSWKSLDNNPCLRE
jgi:L-amino acid N-acyltransferase YncA